MLQGTRQETSYVLARDSEIDEATAYLSTHDKHRDVAIDRYMLKTLFDDLSKQRLPSSKLALLAATVTRDHIAPKDKGNVRIVEAYTSGIMKIMSIRSAIRRERNNRATTVNPATAHPVRKNGQYILL